MASQVVQRISVRWLPEPAYEDTNTIALNVGGYFIDFRVEKESQAIQWSRAGERILLKDDPPTYRWTHIIDSLDLTVPDEAYFNKLSNGDDIEIGSTPCPHKDGAVTEYEEVWRDITPKPLNASSWILQSQDGMTFVGKVGNVYLAIKKGADGSFLARKDTLNFSSNSWENVFRFDNASVLPRADDAIKAVEAAGRDLDRGSSLQIGEDGFIVRAFKK
ncbi:uncharacterized protein FMAN_08414 [Fusarium mangiferae]|uniref:Protein HRI1 n=1 Tax=Fusarium mangiferae TaxID=192010 RepID=A0A1L7TPT9_FUSMA|nr:uncharacterized protein FMAN_08414 [Fusarium mangiferae]CVK98832.1 uncharacterized protein FMAN_08414 [Fusarium mangiferae]